MQREREREGGGIVRKGEKDRGKERASERDIHRESGRGEKERERWDCKKERKIER
jgi:hypothetical protein